jgi:O-antigen ligase
MGDRAFMYDCGWDLFLEHPLTGIGLLNFRLQNALGIDLVLHSEYMVQICECGIIGSILFLIFYYGMAKRIIQLLISGENRQDTLVLLATFVGFLMMSFFAWTYTSIYYFVFFGFIYAVYDNNKSLDIHNS